MNNPNIDEAHRIPPGIGNGICRKLKWEEQHVYLRFERSCWILTGQQGGRMEWEACSGNLLGTAKVDTTAGAWRASVPRLTSVVPDDTLSALFEIYWSMG